MRINGYFGVGTVKSIMNGIGSMNTKAQIALFLGAGLVAFGYFKYGRKGDKNDN